MHQKKNGYTACGIFTQWNVNSAFEEILMHTAVRMNIKNIALSERARHERTNTVWFHFYKAQRTGRFRENEGRIEVTGPGEGGAELSFSGYRVSGVLSCGNGWQWWSHDFVNVLNATEFYTWKWVKWSILRSQSSSKILFFLWILI